MPQGYQPLTREQYQKARQAGFTPQKIIEMEQRRKAEAGATPAPAAQQKVGMGQRILDAATKVSDFFGGKGIADLIGGGIAKAQAAPDAKQFVDMPTPGQVAGSALQLGSMFVPVGAGAKLAATGIAKAAPQLAKVAPKLGQVVAGAGTGAAFDVGNALQGGGVAPVGTALGTALPLVPPVLRGAGKLGGELLGLSTGTGGGATAQMFRAGRQGGAAGGAALDAMRGKIGPDQIVADARDALGTIVSNRTAQYQEALRGISGDAKTYDTSSINNALQKGLEKFRIGVRGSTLDFSRSSIRFDKKAQQEVQTIFDEMRGFGTRKGDRTAVGIDSLKRAFDDLYSDSSNVRAFTASMRDSARKVLKEVPGYDKMVGDYETSTRLIKEIQRGLSLGDKAQTDTAFRKLTGALRTNNEFRKQLIQELEEVAGKELPSQIAGQQMSEMLPRGLMRQLGGTLAGGLALGSGTGIVPLLQAAMFTSPRVVGELLYALGYTTRQAQAIMQKIGGLPRSPGDMLLGGGGLPPTPPALGN